jgi:hypothetical protein
MLPPLLNRLVPYPDESLASLLGRLAAANYYPKLRWLTQFLPGSADPYKSHPNLNLIREQAAYERLVELTHLTQATLTSLTLHRFAPRLQSRECGPWLARGLGNEFIRSQAAGQVCPLCLAEAPYHRLHWDLRPVVVCLQHRVVLMDQCPKCGKPLGTQSLDLSHCVKCRADLREARPAEAEAEGLGAQARISADLGLPVDNPPAWPGRSACAHLLPPDLFALRRALYYVLLELPFTWPGFQPARFDLAENWSGLAGESRRRLVPNPVRYTLMIAAHRVLMDWPKTFYAMLEAGWQVPRPATTTTGVERHFGAWYTHWLTQALADPAFDFVRSAFFDYLTTNYDGSYLQKLAYFRRMSELATTHHRYYARIKAMQLLGLSASDLDQWVAAGRLRAVVGPMGRLGRRVYLVARQDIEAVQSSYQGRLTLKQTALQPGFDRKVVVELVTAGCLPPEGDHLQEGPAFWLFQPEAVMELVERYTASAEAEPFLLRGQTVSLASAVYPLRPAVKNVGEVLSLVDRGLLKPPLRRGQRGLGRLAFSRTELAQCRQTLVGYTGPEVAKHLGAHRRDVCRWLKKGWLRTSPAGFIPQDALAEFRRTYIVSSEAQQVLGICGQTLYKWAQLGLVEPCESRDPSFRRGHLFRRAEIERFNCAERLSVGEAAECLGLDPKQINYLAKRGRLRAVAGPDVNGYGVHFFLKSEVERAKELLNSTGKGIWDRPNSLKVVRQRQQARS